MSTVFDFFDGMSARALGVSSPIGKELDSLADDISFGLVPSMIVLSLLTHTADGMVYWPDFLIPAKSTLSYAAFIIAVFSALRLAKFNIDPRQAHSFIGLPTPANTLFWISFALGYPSLIGPINVLVLIAMILLSSWLLVAEVPMFSLKFENLKWNENKLRYLFLIVCIPLFFLGKICLAAIILWYIILSIANNMKSSNK
jgi:CDP-diacylglycerol--serine O-phosphatidyltransferase